MKVGDLVKLVFEEHVFVHEPSANMIGTVVAVSTCDNNIFPRYKILWPDGKFSTDLMWRDLVLVSCARSD